MIEHTIKDGLKEIHIQGKKGKIYALYRKSPNENSPVILILHGHPRNNLGSYNSPVVQSLIRASISNDFSILAINYRGSGKSNNAFLKDEDGLVDASYALDWLHEEHENNYKFWIAGFSYGSWVAAQLATRRPEIIGIIMISTILFKHDYTFMNPFPCLGLIIHGEMDYGSKFREVKEFFTSDTFKGHQERINIIKLNYCDHFFYQEQNKIDPRLEYTVSEFLREHRNKEIKVKNYIAFNEVNEDQFEHDDIVMLQ